MENIKRIQWILKVENNSIVTNGEQQTFAIIDFVIEEMDQKEIKLKMIVRQKCI